MSSVVEGIVSMLEDLESSGGGTQQVSMQLLQTPPHQPQPLQQEPQQFAQRSPFRGQRPPAPVGVSPTSSWLSTGQSSSYSPQASWEVPPDRRQTAVSQKEYEGLLWVQAQHQLMIHQQQQLMQLYQLQNQLHLQQLQAQYLYQLQFQHNLPQVHQPEGQAQPPVLQGAMQSLLQTPPGPSVPSPATSFSPPKASVVRALWPRSQTQHPSPRASAPSSAATPGSSREAPASFGSSRERQRQQQSASGFETGTALAAPHFPSETQGPPQSPSFEEMSREVEASLKEFLDRNPELLSQLLESLNETLGGPVSQPQPAPQEVPLHFQSLASETSVSSSEGSSALQEANGALAFGAVEEEFSEVSSAEPLPRVESQGLQEEAGDASARSSQTSSEVRSVWPSQSAEGQGRSMVEVGSPRLQLALLYSLHAESLRCLQGQKRLDFPREEIEALLKGASSQSRSSSPEEALPAAPAVSPLVREKLKTFLARKQLHAQIREALKSSRPSPPKRSQDPPQKKSPPPKPRKTDKTEKAPKLGLSKKALKVLQRVSSGLNAQRARSALVKASQGNNLYRVPAASAATERWASSELGASNPFSDPNQAQMTIMVRDIHSLLTAPLSTEMEVILLREKVRSLLIHSVHSSAYSVGSVTGIRSESVPALFGPRFEPLDAAGLLQLSTERRRRSFLQSFRRRTDSTTPWSVFEKPLTMREVTTALAVSLLALDCLEIFTTLFPNTVKDSDLKEFSSGVFSIEALGTGIEGYRTLAALEDAPEMLDSALLFAMLIEQFKRGERPVAPLLVPAKSRALLGEFSLAFDWSLYTEFWSEEERRLLERIKKESEPPQ